MPTRESRAARIEALTHLAIGAPVGNAAAVADFLTVSSLASSRAMTIAEVRAFTTTANAAREAAYILRVRRNEQAKKIARLKPIRERMEKISTRWISGNEIVHQIFSESLDSRRYAHVKRLVARAWGKAGFRRPEGRSPKAVETLSLVLLTRPEEDAKNGVFPSVTTKKKSISGPRYPLGTAVERQLVLRHDWPRRVLRAGIATIDGGFVLDAEPLVDGKRLTAIVAKQSRGFDLRTERVTLVRSPGGWWQMTARQGVV